MFRLIAGIILVLTICAAIAVRRKAQIKTVADGSQMWPGTGLALRLAVWLTGIGAVVLGITGFTATLLIGRPLAGWLLLIHTLGAGCFIVGLTAMALRLAAFFSRPCRESLCPCERQAAFWGFAWAGFFAILSALLMMQPLFGTRGQMLLYQGHRWAALCTVAAGLIFVATARGRKQRRSGTNGQHSGQTS